MDNKIMGYLLKQMTKRHSVHSFFRRRGLGLPNPPYHPALYDSEHYKLCEVP